jgi:hypothetical protein
MSKLPPVYEELADNLHALIDQRIVSEHPGEPPESDEWLDDPEQSFITFLDKTTAATKFASVTATGDLEPQAYSAPNSMELVLSIAGAFRAAASRGREIADPHLEMQNVIHTTQKELLKSEIIEERMLGCCLLGYIAAYNKPDHITETSVLKRHRDETPEERVFRMAITALGQFSDRDYTADEKQPLSKVSRNPQQRKARFLLDPQGVRAAVQISNFGQVRHIGARIKRHVLSSAVSGDQFQEEITGWEKRHDYNQQSQEITQQLPMEETNWEILPAETIGTRERRQTAADKEVETNKNKPAPEVLARQRLEWLGRIAMLWGQGAKIAISKLDSTGATKYQIALLPQHLPDGGTIWHAVAENPADENAIFVFRGEKGVDEGGVWLTWEDVFRGHLGYEDRVLDELTKKATDL